MSTHGTIVILFYLIFHLRWQCLGVRHLSLSLLPRTLVRIIPQFPTVEALYLGEVLFLPLLLLPCRCQSCILFLFFLDPDSFVATSRLGQPFDLFLAKSRLISSWILAQILSRKLCKVTTKRSHSFACKLFLYFWNKIRSLLSSSLML